MSNSRYNDRQLAPGLGDATNRYSEVVFETEIAQPARNSFGHRSGQRQAEEELWRDPRYSSSFVGGAASDQADRNVYEVQQAPNARGRLASGQAIPAWDAVDSATRAGFVQGNDETMRADNPYMHKPRPGANPRSLAPMGNGFQAGERPRTEFGRKMAPPNGGRGRRGTAEIQD
jgi:hypothetical protein